MEIEHENSLKKALREGCNLFLGAGFSLLAKNKEGIELPLASKLKLEMAQHFNRNDLINLDISKLYTIIQTTKKKSYANF